MDVTNDEIVDVHFVIRGEGVPFDHGYALYGALSRTVPTLHGASWLGVHPIRGRRLVSGALQLLGHSTVSLRMPASRLLTVLPLTGALLEVAGARIALRSPTIALLGASPRLDSRNVVLKLTRVRLKPDESIDKPAFEQAFRAELGRQLEELGAQADVALTGRQEIVVGGRRVLGYSVRLSGLSPEASLQVQRAGLGGKRRMGCGLFVPTRGRA